MSTIGPFEVLGFSEDIKDYKCFEDLGRNEWIDGTELKVNAAKWTDKQKEKWHFFHRPVRPLVGLGQRLMISELRERKTFLKQELMKNIARIRGEEEKKSELALIKEGLGIELIGMVEPAGDEEDPVGEAGEDIDDLDDLFEDVDEITLALLDRRYKIEFVKMKRGLLAIAIVFAALTPLIAVFDLIYGFGFGALMFPVLVIFLNNRYNELHRVIGNKEGLHRQIDGLWSNYKDESDAIESQIDDLEGQISRLSRQVSARPVASCIESWLEQEISELERESLYEVLSTEMEQVGPREDYFKKKGIGDRSPLMLKGWALLQPSKSFSYYEKGDKKLFSDVQISSHKLATWRAGTRNQPLFRVYNLTFFFFLENKLVMRSFFYDFISEQRFGITEQDFIYSHISDYSIRHVEIGDGKWVRELGMSPLFVESVFNREVSRFSLSMSSGEQFNSLLIDQSVIKGINQWLGYEEQIRRLVREHSNNLADNTDKINQLIEIEPAIINKWMKTDENKWNDDVEQGLLQAYEDYYGQAKLQEQVSPDLRRFIDQFDDYLEAKMQDYL